jgi:hypothetical protein
MNAFTSNAVANPRSVIACPEADNPAQGLLLRRKQDFGRKNKNVRTSMAVEVMCETSVKGPSATGLVYRHVLSLVLGQVPPAQLDPYGLPLCGRSHWEKDLSTMWYLGSAGCQQVSVSIGPLRRLRTSACLPWNRFKVPPPHVQRRSLPLCVNVGTVPRGCDRWSDPSKEEPTAHPQKL